MFSENGNKILLQLACRKARAWNSFFTCFDIQKKSFQTRESEKLQINQLSTMQETKKNEITVKQTNLVSYSGLLFLLFEISTLLAYMYVCLMCKNKYPYTPKRPIVGKTVFSGVSKWGFGISITRSYAYMSNYIYKCSLINLVCPLLQSILYRMICIRP